MLLWLVARNCRAVAEGYSPFHHPGRDLPNPGTGVGWLDGGLMVAAPVLVPAQSESAVSKPLYSWQIFFNATHS